MDKKVLIENLVREAHEKGLFTGTWLYAEHGEIISKGACGWRDPEDRLPMQEDSIFELASITKQFTATAVMLLIRQGLLCLEDEITDYFPEIPFPGVTIRHLLNHTGGIPDIYISAWVFNLWKEEKKIPSNSIILRYLTESGEGPHFAPGEKYEYSNTGYNLLAETVEKVSGMPFEEFLKKNLFEPAGMRDTGIYHIRRDGIPSDAFVRNLVLEDGEMILPDISKEYYDIAAVDGLNGDDYVYTNIFDMLLWDKALREEKILTRKEQQMMYTPGRLNDGEPSGAREGVDGYGFGWEVMRDPELGLIVAHSGGMPGLRTWFERFLDADRVLVILCCRDAVDEKGCDAFFESMRAIARDKEKE